MKKILEKAWERRAQERVGTDALRLFHGPLEGSGLLARIAIERFGDHDWIYEWDSGEKSAALDFGSQITRESLKPVLEFLIEKGSRSVVYLARPRGSVPVASPEILHGAPPEFFDVTEDDARFRIRFQNTRHPGLFLDHRPLRQWLRKNLAGRRSVRGNAHGGAVSGPSLNKGDGLKVLNTFSYTGSLSVASALGGASHVTTLDLSKPTIAWAKENWELNGFSLDRPSSSSVEEVSSQTRFQADSEASSQVISQGDFIFGDYFEWLPRMSKRGDRFDAVILDPPSFSRGTKGTFSTSKDLVSLHALALSVLNPGGLLITSINSAKVSAVEFENQVLKAAQAQKRRLKKIETLGAPRASFAAAGYLKGWIFEVS